MPRNLDQAANSGEISTMIAVTRYHDFSAAHRIVGHQGKCARIHGHNYRVHFHCQGEPNEMGIVIDFANIKNSLCAWIDTNWDHRLIMWSDDLGAWDLVPVLGDDITFVPFNTTAENMAQYLLEVVGPDELPPNIQLAKVIVEETRKCSAMARAEQW